MFDFVVCCHFKFPKKVPLRGGKHDMQIDSLFSVGRYFCVSVAIRLSCLFGASDPSHKVAARERFAGLAISYKKPFRVIALLRYACA